MPDTNLGRRAHPRLRLAIGARLITHHGTYAVRLDNLSVTGAHLSRPNVEDFTGCVLRWLGFEALGEKVWQRGAYCGIRFDQPLPESWIAETRKQVPIIPDGWLLPVPSRVRRL